MMRLFLVLFIVCLGLSYVHPENEVEANPSKIQESFHSFFNSIGNNNGPQTKIYRNLLEREAVKERQAFDLAKEELQETRRRYPRKQRNPPHSDGEIRAKAAVSKREATEDKDETVPAPEKRRKSRKPKIPVYSMDFEDDKFVEKYGNDNATAGRWEAVRRILEDDHKIRNVCSEAHNKYFGRRPNLTATEFRVKQLNFINSPQYQPMDLDVLMYTTEFNYQAPNTPYIFHLTKGIGADCIYYLVPLTPSQLTVQLQEHVCGLKLPFEA